jgi:multiple sugar transport system permease protein
MTTAVLPTRTGVPPGRSARMLRRRQRFGWLFVAPFAVVFLLFLVLPLAYALYLSLQSSTLVGGDKFVGLENYANALTDPLFLGSVVRVLEYVLILIPIQLVVAVAAALVLDTLTSRFSRFARVMMFVPYAIPVVVGAIMWGFLYSPNFGPLTQIFGSAAPNLLTSQTVYFALTNIVTWGISGYYMVIVYSALQAIDPSIYEAALLDGANRLQIAFRVKLPMISSSLVLIIVFALIGTLQFFTEPSVLQGVSNGAITASYTPNMYAYNVAFQYNQFNYASAISFLLGLVIFIGSYIFLFFTRKRGGLQ